MQKEKGLEACPLSFRMLHETDASDIKQPSPRTDSTNSQSYVSFQSSEPGKSFQSSEPGQFVSFPSFNVSHNIASFNANGVDKDYESLTLMRLVVV